MTDPFSIESSGKGSDPGKETALPITAADTARYMRDLLEDLREIAVHQDQVGLACVLDAAVREAERLVEPPR